MARFDSRYYDDNFSLDLENTYVLAKLGDTDAQFKLLNYFRMISKSIALSFKKSLWAYGINDYDLENIFIETFEAFMMNDDELVYNTPNYFKYLYIQKIKTLVRNKARLIEKEHDKSNDYISSLVNDDNLASSDNEEYFKDNEISTQVLQDPKSNLTFREKYALELFLDGYKMKEIAEQMNVCYSVSFRALKSALGKSKIYLEKYIDLF